MSTYAFQSVLDLGLIQGEQQLLDKASGYERLIIAQVEYLTNWWEVKLMDGDAVLYIGTVESFEEWKKEQIQ